MSEILAVENLTKLFPVPGKFFRSSGSSVHAVDELSFKIFDRDSLALVGESGCGKTTTGRLIAGLESPTEGKIFFKGEDITGLLTLEGSKENHQKSRKRELRPKIQLIFQDPYDSLNPRMSINEILSEPLEVNSVGSRMELLDSVKSSLNLVGLSPAETFLERYPHELSGGQRQRVAIARAVILNPSFIVADEPTSMLDVSVRAGIMELFAELTERIGATYLYITHDLAVARYMVHRIGVMYLGKIVELGLTEEILSSPIHPYTRALIQAVPVPDPRVNKWEPEIIGQISRPIDPPDYCRFYERCPIRTENCLRQKHPPLKDFGNGHYAACYEME